MSTHNYEARLREFLESHGCICTVADRLDAWRVGASDFAGWLARMEHQDSATE
jgi:hypothetical protein